MKNFNPNVETFLKIYSQSLISTGLTRGLDERTYIPTRLDTALKSDVLEGKKKLVVLTGNAGDGKTAFIQLIESHARENGADFTSITDNGCKFKYYGYDFETLYDGSQDFEGKTNEVVLSEFFRPFEGSSEPHANIVKIIAINEGKLRDFILNKPKYSWLGKVVHHYLEFPNPRIPDILSFINLNNRAVVEINDHGSILDELLDNFLDIYEARSTWEHCKSENCSYADRCYIKYNIDAFRNSELGPNVRNRFKELVLAAYLKKKKHITIRDIRSLLSYMLFNKFTCVEIQAEINNESNMLDRFYYNNVFGKGEQDRMIDLLSGIDVSDMTLPKIENHLYFLQPDNNSFIQLFIRNNITSKADSTYFKEYFDGKPEGTSDLNKDRKWNAEMYLSSLKRKIFFEGDDSYLSEHFSVDHYSFLPYKYYKRYTDFLVTGMDTSNSLRDDIVLAISKSEKIYNEIIGRENLCIGNSKKKSLTKAFYSTPAHEFEVVLPVVREQNKYVEYFPDHLIFRHVGKKVTLEVNIDLFEILMRIKEGYIPTSIEIQTFFLNLEMFKRRLLSKGSTRIYLTEDDSNLYAFEKSASGKLVLMKS